MLPPTASRLGLGVTGPHAGPAVAPAQTALLVREAIARGVTLFDTGPMYGAGEGERRLGAALREAPRAGVFICTKARTWTPDSPDAPADSVRRSLDLSLGRLGLHHVDALLLHGPRPADVAPALAALRADGRATRVGVCGRGPELVAGLDAGADLLMAPVAGADALLSRAAAAGAAVFAIETMRGRGRVRAPTSLADAWYLARAARDALRGTTPGMGVGVADALRRPAVASVIVQTTRLAHLIENARAAGVAAA
jgi:aryl-alcohol dehydrogenase-like predicted oxidoreductase